MKKIETLDEYLSLYGKAYPKEAISDIKKLWNEDAKIDILLQIKSKLGLIPTEVDHYQGFINHLKENGLLHGKILEIGSGFYPTLAEKIINEPEVEEVTGIDPYLVTTNIKGLTLVRGRFKADQNIEKYDVVIAMLPCSATLSIIEAANQKHKPFSIVLCKCTHFPSPMLFQPITSEKWENYVLNKTKSTLDENATLSETHFDEEYQMPYKILTKTYKSS